MITTLKHLALALSGVMLTLTQAQAACWTAEQETELNEMISEYQSAKKEDPLCARGRGAAACLSPMSMAILASLQTDKAKCALDAWDFSPLQGTWDIVERTCYDVAGNTHPPVDRFVMGRDELRLVISGSDLRYRVTIDGATYGGSMVIGVNVSKVAMTGIDFGISTDNRKSFTQYDIDLLFPGSDPDAKILVIESSGFGEGGSCQPGETLKSYFKYFKNRR